MTQQEKSFDPETCLMDILGCGEDCAKAFNVILAEAAERLGGALLSDTQQGLLKSTLNILVLNRKIKVRRPGLLYYRTV